MGNLPQSYSTLSLKLGGSIERQFHFRPGTSDEPVIREIFEKSQYDLQRLRRNSELAEFVKRGLQAGKRPLIVDAGANIGASPVFFLANTANAVVVAIEPDPKNFALLQKNVEGLAIQPVQAAVSASNGQARVLDPGEGNWGYRTEIVSGSFPDAVPRVTIGEIYRHYAPYCFPYIAKIDIEGGEADLFSGNTEWVEQTPLLIVELHDWLLPKSGNSRQFLQCISKLDRDFVYIGENIYSIANNLD